MDVKNEIQTLHHEDVSKCLQCLSPSLTRSPSLCRRTKSQIWKSAKSLKRHSAAGYQNKKHLASQREHLKSV